MAKPSSTASASERRLRVTSRRQGGGQQRRSDVALGGSDALQIVPPPPPPGDRRPAAIAATVVFGGDLIALGSAMLVTRPADGVNAIYALFAMVALLTSGAYRLRISLSALDEAPRLATVLAVPLLLLAPFAHAAHSHLLWQAVFSVVAVVVMRAIGYALLRRARRRGLAEATLVAGTGHVGVELANLIIMHPEYGLELTGFVGSPYPGLPRPLVGDVDDLDRIVVEHGIKRVLVAFGPTREAELVGVLRTAVLRDVEVHVVPRFFEVGVAPRGPDVDDLWGIPIYRMRQAALRARVWRFKRAVDIVLSLILLIVTAPVMAISALAVRLGSRVRCCSVSAASGSTARRSMVLKFRTLPADHIDDSWNAANDEYNAGRPVVAPHEHRRAAAAVERAARRHEPRRTAARTRLPRRAVQRVGVRLPRPPPPAGRPHRLGAGARPARRHVAARTGALRQPVHRALVVVARRRDPRAHAERRFPRAGDDVASRSASADARAVRTRRPATNRPPPAAEGGGN